MEKVEKYREYIQSILTDYAESKTSHNPDDKLEMQTIFDTVRDHYQLIYVRWDKKDKRVYGPVMHLDIKNGKIWIQWNGTEDDIGTELIEKGVPKEDIVIEFQTPFMRKFSDYAVS
ncbi:MAG: XisI protein [Rivularia sp. (in: cyanobacteria)]